MVFSYDDPLVNDKDWIRLRLGDTNSNGFVLHDEEIQANLSECATRNKALIQCGEDMLVKLSQRVDYTIGPEKVSASQAFENFKKTLDSIRKRYSVLSAPYASISTPTFRIGIHDNKHV